MSYANDNLSNATIVSGSSGSITPFHYDGVSDPATSETGEDVYGAGETLWWKWTAPSSGGFAFDVLGSPSDDAAPNGLDTKMQVFSGPSSSPTHGSLSFVDNNDDNSDGDTYDYNSRVSFTASSGTTYYIQVDQYSSGQQGTIHLAWAPYVAPIPPVGYWSASPGRAGNFHFAFAGDVITVTDISTAGVTAVSIGGAPHAFTVVDSSSLTITVTSDAGSGPILIDGVPVHGDALVLYPSPWYTPPPTYAQSRYRDVALEVPPEHTVNIQGTPWSHMVEPTAGEFGSDVPHGTFLGAETDEDGPRWYIGQSHFDLPLQAAWDSTYNYSRFGGTVYGGMSPYSYPPDPAAPDPLPDTIADVEYESTGPSAGTLSTPLHARVRLRPQTVRTNDNGQGVESITALELPTTSPYHPNNLGGSLGYVPRSVLLTLNVLWQGVPTNNVTEVEPDLTLPTSATDKTSVLVVPTAMLSTTAPTRSPAWSEVMGGRPEVEVRYQGPRYRLLYIVPPVSARTTTPPLRQYQRDDGLTGGVRSQFQASSRQASLRQTSRSTYL